MLNGLRHGRGVQIWEDGAKYDGEWEYDKAHGVGTFYHADGDIYQGQWDNDSLPTALPVKGRRGSVGFGNFGID